MSRKVNQVPFILAPPNATLGTIGIGNLSDRKLPCLYARELNQSITILATFKSPEAVERMQKWLADCAEPAKH